MILNMILFWLAEKAAGLIIMLAIGVIVVACMGASALWRKLSDREKS